MLFSGELVLFSFLVSRDIWNVTDGATLLLPRVSDVNVALWCISLQDSQSQQGSYLIPRLREIHASKCLFTPALTVMAVAFHQNILQSKKGCQMSF